MAQQQQKSNLAGGLLMLAMLMSCSTSVPTAAPEVGTSPQAVAAAETASAGQSLPISAQVKIANQVIQLEVAKTIDEQAIGLMYRSELKPDRGMLFPFDSARPVSFWMKNVVINLDMVFLRGGKVVAIASNVPPCRVEPCPVYGPKAAVDAVVELRGGRAQELGIKAGDRLTIQSIAAR